MAEDDSVADDGIEKDAGEGSEPSSSQTGGPQLFYNDRVVDHFLNPRNVGELPEAADVVSAVVGDPACGDQMRLWIGVREDRIERIRFQSFGCPGAIATSSMLTELAEGRTLEEACALSDDDVIEALGGIPERKRHCSLMGVQALQAAVAEYRRRHGGGE